MNPIHRPMDMLRARFNQEIPGPGRDVNVSVYRDFVVRNDELISTPELAKNDELAIQHRQSGNRAFQELRYDEALRLYNESICYAETQSEQLGIGYGNRSAVYYKQHEYEFALYNVDLARKHSYPERLLLKLLAREAECKRMISHGFSNGAIPHPMVDMNVEVNPRIPFLANGIGMGRGLVAERVFNAGDVILNEKVDLCAVLFERSYCYCAHCGSEFRKSLIPCPGCVVVMYCGEECREKDFQCTHRFECSVATKLWSVTYSNGMIQPRLFFYGLTAFNGNINEMMTYCMTHTAVGSKPLEFDYTSPNSLDVFKVLHQTPPNRDPTMEYFWKLQAAVYHLIFMKNPLVQTIFRTEAQRDFMLRCLHVHGRVATSKAFTSISTTILSPIGSICNLSCDPNAIRIVDCGTIKMIVVRPIRKGEPIVTTDNRAWWLPDAGSKHSGDCPVCDSGRSGAEWREAHDRERMQSAQVEQVVLGTERATMNKAAELGNFQRLIQLLASEGHHPGVLFGEMMSAYYVRLVDFVLEQNVKRDRVRLLQAGGYGVVPGLFDEIDQ